MKILHSKKLIAFLVALIFGLNFVSAVLADVPLVVSNVKVEPTDKTALISWNTDQPASGRVDFGLTEDNYSWYVEEGTAKSTIHAVTLSGLAPETTYHFKISSKTSTQEVATFDRTFKTKKLVDSQAPIITAVRAPYITGTTATIQWETNENSDSRVYYGKTENYGQVKSSSNKVKIHDITISGLNPATYYHFLVKSADSAGNITRYYDLTFKTNDNNWTDKEPLQILDLKPVASNDPQLKDTTAGIYWRTSKLASGKVYFGETEKLGKTVDILGPRDFFHSTTLKDLKPNTKYYFKVESVDVFGKVIRSDLYSFNTRDVSITKATLANVAGGAGMAMEVNPTFYASYNVGFPAEVAGGSNQANPTGAVSLVEGKDGTGVKIGLGSQLEYLGPGNFDINQGTISFWFKPDWDSGDGQNHVLFDLNPFYKSTGDKYFMVAKISSSDQGIKNELAFGLEDSNDRDYWAYLDKVEIKAGQWYLVTASWQYNGGFYKLYLDGETSNLTYVKNGTKGKVALGQPPTLGAKFYVGSVKGIMAGSSTEAAIDELMIFDRVLNDEEVEQLYAAGAGMFIDSGIGGPDETTGAVLGAATFDYTQATALLRVKGSPDVYAVMAGQRHYISGPNSFSAYGYNWNKVKDVSREELEKYPVARLLKTPDSRAVYYIYERPQNKWFKIAIPSPTVFVSYPQNFWGDIITVTQEDVNAYPDVQLIKTADSAQVYLLSGPTARPFASSEVFESLGYNWAEVGEISEEHLGAYKLVSW